MATVSKTKDLEGIPPMLQRKGNGYNAEQNIADLMAELEAMRAKNAQLEAQVARKSTLALKVSDKGAVSLYGLGRFPLTLYSAQWQRVLDMADDIRAFIEANKDKLSWK